MKADRSAVFERFDCAPGLRLEAHERLAGLQGAAMDMHPIVKRRSILVRADYAHCRHVT